MANPWRTHDISRKKSRPLETFEKIENTRNIIKYIYLKSYKNASVFIIIDVFQKIRIYLRRSIKNRSVIGSFKR